MNGVIVRVATLADTGISTFIAATCDAIVNAAAAAEIAMSLLIVAEFGVMVREVVVVKMPKEAE